MVVTKITKRKRKKPEWLIDDVYPILDLTEDGDDSKSVSISGVDSSEDGRKSTLKTVGSSFDRDILLGDQEDHNLLSSSPAKSSPVAKSPRVEVQSPTNTELENHIKSDASQIVLPVESIQPPTMIDRLHLKLSAQAVEVRGGDNKESMVYEWPLEDILRIGVHYLSEEEEDTSAFVAVRVSVPSFSLSGSGKEIDECLLQIPKFRDSVVDISKLSPIFGGIIEELKKEDVEKTARKIKMRNSQASTPLFSSSSEELDEAIDAFKVLVYPQGDPDAVTITQKDIKILKPFEFINDTIIDFYIKYLQQTIVSPEKLKTLHFFNTFFFSKLAEIDAGGAAAFERVKKWTRKVNVFEKDFVFIPVNQSLHWSLIIICHPGHMWDVSTINGSSDGDACILHLDSMEGCHRGVEARIKNYLFQEWIERNKDPEDLPYAEEFFSGMPYRYSKVPQQDNSCDCGLFLLHYVELFLKTAPSVYRTKRQRSPPTQFLRRNWFKPLEASAKRRVIQKLILELSQERSLESLRDFTEVKENAPNGVFPADEELTRALSMSLRGDNQSSSQSRDELGPVHSDPLHQVKEPLIENCPYARSEEVELHDDLSRFLNSDCQDELVNLQHVDVSTEDRECNDIRSGMHHIGSDQPNVSCKSGADVCSAHISVNDDLKAELEAVVLPDGETWNHEKCPVPRLPLQVKPLQVPTLLDEVQLYCQPSAAVDLGIQVGSETSDDLTGSFVNEDARRSQKKRPLLDFDSILSPEEVNRVTAGNDDEMYESNPFDAKQRWSTSRLQPEVVSPVIGTPKHVRLSPVRSPESLHALSDDYFKEGGRTVERTVESRRRPVKFRNKTLPFGRCSELNMQGAHNCGQSKNTEDRNLTRKDSHQPYGFSVYSEEVQEIEELSSDDSSDSSKQWDFEKRSPEPNVKGSSIEVEQRVTRSKSQRSHGLPLSTEKQARKDALAALCKQKGSRRR